MPKFVPYFGGGLMLQSYGLENIDTSMGLALQFIGGASYMITPAVSVGLDLRYMIAIVESKLNDTESNIGLDQLFALAHVKFGF